MPLRRGAPVIVTWMAGATPPFCFKIFPMAVSASYLQWAVEQLNAAAQGTVTARRMFGGAGLYCQGFFFGLVSDDALFFREGSANRDDFAAAGSEPFDPMPDRMKPMPYRSVPEEILEDNERLADWLIKAITAAREAKTAQPKKSKGRK